ncbi:hypothetical protein PG987_002028 [Apiospora arundinis]
MQSSHDSIVLPKVRGGALPRRTTSDTTSLLASSRDTAGPAKKTSPYIGIRANKPAMATAPDRSNEAGTSSQHQQQHRHRTSHGTHHSISRQKEKHRTMSPSSSVVSASAHRRGGDTSHQSRRRTLSPSQHAQPTGGRPSPLASPAPPAPASSSRPVSPHTIPPIIVQPPTSPPRRRDSSSASASGSAHQRPSTNHSKSHRRRPRRHNHRHTSSGSSNRAATAGGSAAAATSGHGNHKSPFHSGLQDILQGVFGHGAQGPTMNEVEKLPDELGDLIQGALMEKLVAELRAGLLEKLLIEYLEELVTGVVVHGLDRANRKRKDKDGKDHGGAADWKKTALKRAIKIFMERITKKSP